MWTTGELPSNITVSHKEGSINGVATDAGIVFGRRPYILVVLSQGITDENEAFGDIAKISRIVYDFQQQFPPAKDLDLPKI